MFQTFGPAHVWFLALALRWTCLLFAIALVGGTIGGALLVVMGLSRRRWLNWPAQAFVYVVQGTPLLVQLFLAYFGAIFAGLEVPPVIAAAIAFTLYASAYLGEIWRGAIVGVNKGQREAARALGLRPWPTMRLVILPQALRPAIPPSIGFIVHLVKNTALASVLGYTELTRAGQLVANATFQPLPVYLTVAAFYFVLCYPLSLAARGLEARVHGGARGLIHQGGVE